MGKVYPSAYPAIDGVHAGEAEAHGEAWRDSGAGGAKGGVGIGKDLDIKLEALEQFMKLMEMIALCDRAIEILERTPETRFPEGAEL